VRAGLAALLNDQESLDVAGQVDETDVSDSVHMFQPDVLIWDAGYDVMPMMDVLAESSGISGPIIALTAAETDAAASLARLHELGVRALLPQNVSADVLSAVVIAAAAGLTTMGQQGAEAIFARLGDPTPGEREQLADAFTPREREVLALVAEGLPNKTIALRLSISEHTVKFHLNAILSKLNAQSRTEAVVRATRLGLLAL
jgi:DNA-binding NarL/FixJ family response regulator